MHPSEYKWRRGDLETLKRIYMYYGKYFPCIADVEEQLSLRYPCISWENHILYKIAYPYSDRTYHHEKYSDREHMNMFADEFIEWLGETN